MKQQTFISDSSKNMQNVGNILSLMDSVKGAENPTKALGALQRHGAAATSGKVQYLGKWQSSVFLWAVTDGKAGFSPLQLSADIPLFEYIVGEYSDDGVVSRICKDMALHPDPARQLTWRRIQRDLSGDEESVKRYKKDLKQDIALMRKSDKGGA